MIPSKQQQRKGMAIPHNGMLILWQRLTRSLLFQQLYRYIQPIFHSLPSMCHPRQQLLEQKYGHFTGLMQKRHNAISNALKLSLFCIESSNWCVVILCRNINTYFHITVHSGYTAVIFSLRTHKDTTKLAHEGEVNIYGMSFLKETSDFSFSIVVFMLCILSCYTESWYITSLEYIFLLQWNDAGSQYHNLWKTRTCQSCNVNYKLWIGDLLGYPTRPQQWSYVPNRERIHPELYML